MNFIKKNHEHRNINSIGVSKTFKMLLLIAAIAFSNAISASTNPIETVEPETVKETISKLLKNPRVQFNKDMNAMVKFTINDDNEIVVLSVDTQNEAFESFIKTRLNYKKISKQAIGNKRNFSIPVTLIW